MKKCIARTKLGVPCKNKAMRNGKFCSAHTKKIDYRKYMTSAAWKKKRASFIASRLTSNDCYCCDKPYRPGFNLHHLTYARLGHERFADLRMVCAPCHEKIHLMAFQMKSIAFATHALRSARGLPLRTKMRK